MFKICLEYWSMLSSDLYRENPFSATPLLLGARSSETPVSVIYFCKNCPFWIKASQSGTVTGHSLVPLKRLASSDYCITFFIPPLRPHAVSCTLLSWPKYGAWWFREWRNRRRSSSWRMNRAKSLGSSWRYPSCVTICSWQIDLGTFHKTFLVKLSPEQNIFETPHEK